MLISIYSKCFFLELLLSLQNFKLEGKLSFHNSVKSSKSQLEVMILLISLKFDGNTINQIFRLILVILNFILQNEMFLIQQWNPTFHCFIPDKYRCKKLHLKMWYSVSWTERRKRRRKWIFCHLVWKIATTYNDLIKSKLNGIFMQEWISKGKKGKWIKEDAISSRVKKYQNWTLSRRNF